MFKKRLGLEQSLAVGFASVLLVASVAGISSIYSNFSMRHESQLAASDARRALLARGSPCCSSVAR